MDWTERLNTAIAYMEEHMTEEIDYVEVAKIAHCSSFHFQRMFSYIAGLPLSEYIRRRKMTLAAVDLQCEGIKIIDVALKYGYSSPTAFNRAFRSIHGVAPSRVKDGVTLKSYPLISFKLIAKGVAEMEFRIVEKDAIRVLGVSEPLSGNAEKAFEQAEALWARVITEGAEQVKYGNGTVCAELNRVKTANPEHNGFFGFQLCHDENLEYMIGVESNLPETDILKEDIIPAHTWAVFSGKNFFADEHSDAESFRKLDERIYTEWLPTSGYETADEFDVLLLPATDNLEVAPFEMWLPVKKK